MLSIRMMAAAALLLVLAGCDDSKERAAFARDCGDAGFTREQCVFLARIRGEAQSDNNANAALSGAAIGLAATARR